MIIVRVVGLPLTVRGLTVPDKDGNFNIFLNKNLSQDMQRTTYHHELNHITQGHFQSADPVDSIEKMALNKGGLL